MEASSLTIQVRNPKFIKRICIHNVICASRAVWNGPAIELLSSWGTLEQASGTSYDNWRYNKPTSYLIDCWCLQVHWAWLMTVTWWYGHGQWNIQRPKVSDPIGPEVDTVPLHWPWPGHCHGSCSKLKRTCRSTARVPPFRMKLHSANKKDQKWLLGDSKDIQNSRQI